MEENCSQGTLRASLWCCQGPQLISVKLLFNTSRTDLMWMFVNMAIHSFEKLRSVIIMYTKGKETEVFDILDVFTPFFKKGNSSTLSILTNIN